MAYRRQGVEWKGWPRLRQGEFESQFHQLSSSPRVCFLVWEVGDRNLVNRGVLCLIDLGCEVAGMGHLPLQAIGVRLGALQGDRPVPMSLLLPPASFLGSSPA